ncbi:hypothetical protein [Rivularia sp. UHCC 0363]|uniref:hypothetical protein n=1 Tax=Rivularia sp. UHCC 0363 TaxID=3110244 RepID=UPI002B1F6D80|nr:hypothetical protein [Rivularia sp. UHCC 0363]MEA5592826.1 hypothetical protein [Rivularia sp. UHCC 0363]
MIKLNCPVCEYPEIKGNICHNCDTDILLIRRLQELPLVEKSDSIKLLISKVIILLLGMGLAILCSYIFVQPIHSVVLTPISLIEGAGGEGTNPQFKAPENYIKVATARRTFDGFPDQF